MRSASALSLASCGSSNRIVNGRVFVLLISHRILVSDMRGNKIVLLRCESVLRVVLFRVWLLKYHVGWLMSSRPENP